MMMKIRNMDQMAHKAAMETCLPLRMEIKLREIDLEEVPKETLSEAHRPQDSTLLMELNSKSSRVEIKMEPMIPSARRDISKYQLLPSVISLKMLLVSFKQLQALPLSIPCN